MKNSTSDIGILILRVIFGLSLSLAHGSGKLPPSDKFIEGVTSIGFPLPLVFAWAASLAEFAGGLCVALGFVTRPAAFFMAFTMAVAFFGVHSSDPFKVKELAMLYGSAAIAILFLGAGRLSIDAFMRDKIGPKGKLARLFT